VGGIDSTLDNARAVSHRNTEVHPLILAQSSVIGAQGHRIAQISGKISSELD